MNSRFRKVFSVCILLMLFSSLKMQANHLLGADIGWKALPGDSFEFTVSVYRNCSGIALSNSPFTFFGTASGYTTPVSVCGSLCCTKDITPAGSSCNPCKDPKCYNGFGEQLILEKVRIKFPTGCCDWFVSWAQNSRDGAITTGAAGEKLYVEAEINTCLSKPDNSPYFLAAANNFYCLNTCVAMPNAAMDIDSSSKGLPDSLVYSLVSPLLEHGKPVTYSKGYSYNYPLQCNTDSPCYGFLFDNTTGTVSCNISKNDVSVMAIRIDEYRQDAHGKYVFTGSVMRDMELMTNNTQTCPYKALNNHPPIITGINEGPTYSIKICEEQQTCFSIKAFDQDGSDSVKMTSDNTISGASFTLKNDGKKWPTGTFCFNAKKGQGRTQPYVFTIYAQDNHQPNPGKTSRQFLIYVDKPPKAAYSVVNNCGTVTFSAHPIDSSEITDYLWTGSGSPGYGPLFGRQSTFVFQYVRQGIYHFTLTVTNPSGCRTSYNDSVIVGYPVSILPTDTVVCEKSPYIVLMPKYTGGIGPYKYYWNTGETGSQKSALITKDTSFWVVISDKSGCTGDTSVIRIHFRKDQAHNDAVNIRGCWGHTVLLHATVNSQTVTWSKFQNHKLIFTIKGPSDYYAIDSGLYVAYLYTEPCAGSDSFRVTFNPYVKIAPIDTDVCLGDYVTLVPKTTVPNAAINWIDLVHHMLVGTGPTYSFRALNNSNGYQFLLTFSVTTNGVTCVDSSYAKVRIHNKPVPVFKLILPQCVNNPPVFVGIGSSCTKKPSAIVNGYLYPSILGSGTWFITSIFKGPFGCSTIDSQMVTITNSPQINAGPDTTLLRACGKYILSNSHVNPLTGGVWSAGANTPASSIQYSGDTVFFNPAFTPVDGTYTLKYSYIDPTGTGLCDGADSLKITVLSHPKILFSPNDTICNGLYYFYLYGSPGGGIWKFLDSTNPGALKSGNNLPVLEPDLAGAGIHKLQYFVFPNNKCFDSAKSEIYILPEPKTDFKTEDNAWAYCSGHNPVRLIPVDSAFFGSGFSGSGVFMTGKNGYFDPRVFKYSGDVAVTINAPYFYGRCIHHFSHTIKVNLVPGIEFVTDTVICGNDKIYHLRALLSNITNKVIWKSIYNNQDGGYFLNEVTTNTSSEVDYVPGPDQLKQGKFTVYLTSNEDPPCNTVSQSITIHIKQGPVPDFVSNREGCDPFTTTFKDNSYDSSGKITRYEWDFGDGFGFTGIKPIHTFAAPNGDSLTFYDVSLKVYSDEGCSKTIKKPNWIIVHASPKPVISAIPTFTTLDKPTIRFALSNQSRNCDSTDSSTTFEWHFGSYNSKGVEARSSQKNPGFSYLDTGKYTVVLKVTNAAGCTGTDSEYHLIDIRPAFAIFIPNIFLPGTIKGGGTHINKIFKPVLTSYSSFNMTIFNRWGELMFETSNPENGWDGTYKGKTIPEGVYIYNIEAHNLRGEAFKYNGTVSVIK